MKHLHVLVFVFLSFAFQDLFGQNSDLQSRYLNGKELYQLGKYELAMEAFRGLAQEPGNELIEYSSFYYALSAYKADQMIVAENMFLQILHKYPTWSQKDEVLYWLSKIKFEKKKYDKALSYAESINQKSVKEDVLAMKVHHLSQLEDLEKLKELAVRYPSDKETAEILAKNLKQSVNPENVALLKELVKRHNLDKKQYMPEALQTQFKQVYKIAVMLPFMYNELAVTKNPKGNHFVIDIYEGIRLAKEELAKEGINVELFAYDTRRDSAYTAEILIKPELKQMDLIIGPLYPAPVKLVSEYAQQNKINMFNPLSTNSGVIGTNPYSFLYKPTVETQAVKAAEFAAGTFYKTHTLVVYTPNPKDSLMAHTYKERIEEEGFTVDLIKSSQAKTLLNYLTARIDEEDPKSEFVVPMGSIGHIFVASTNESLLANTITALEVRGEQIALIGQEEWLDSKFISYDQLEKLNVYLLSPNFIDYAKEPVRDFRSLYQKNVKNMPGTFAHNGFDMMLFLGRMLHTHGTKFQTYLYNAGFIEGKLLPGYSYFNANDNQFVPIVKFQDAKLEMVNK